ncbi:MAG TPA: pyrroline-5-carboxylate reductase [Armatimonadota bacterium]|jgi:pyrroline-5-carboxylate reductase
MKLTIIGAGKMGEALGLGIVQAGLLAPQDLTFADVAQERVQALAAQAGAVAAQDNVMAVREASVVILAVKPKDVPAVCREIAPALPAHATVLSIAAGVTLRTMSDALAREDVVLARAMPNTPCLVGQGAIGLSFAPGAPAEARALVSRLLHPTGLVEEMPESLLDAVTGLSGSGPAFVALFIEALSDGGVLMGLPRAQALQLAAQTVLGTAQLLLQTGQHPAQIKDAVSSPGGTTIAGVEQLEQGAFRATTIAAVKAATLRSRALSGEV